MFGLKKKESADSVTVSSVGSSKFQVHTMQDDINQINGTTSKSATKNPATPDVSKQSTKDSPFFTNAPTSQKAPTTTESSPWLTDEPKKQPSHGMSVNTSPSPAPAPAPSLDKEIKIPDTKGEGSIAKAFIPENQVTPKPQAPAPAPMAKDLSVDLPQVKAAPAKVNVPTSPLDTLVPPKDTASEVPRSSDRSPVNDIEAEISSFTNKKESPSGISSQKITTFSPLTQTPDEMFQDMGGPVKEEGKAKQTKKKKKGGLKKLLKILITLLLLALLAVGGYFGYKYMQDQDLVNLDDIPGADLINPTNDEDQDVPDQGVVEQDEQDSPEIADKKYAVDFPNYIELTDDTGGSQEFSQKVREIALNLPSQNLAAPISFLITDPDGTPLTFRAFATLTNMTLPPAVLDQADSAFEIYAYENLGDVRFGISFEYLDKQQMSNALSDNEIVLPQAFTPLYNDLEVAAPTPFADNVYGNYPVRFSNLRDDESLSIDYTVADKVYVGTSMMSQRSILDKYALEN